MGIGTFRHSNAGDLDDYGLRRVAAAVLAVAVRDAVVRPPGPRQSGYPWREFGRRFHCARRDLPGVELAIFFQSTFADLLCDTFLGTTGREAWAKLKNDRATRTRARTSFDGSRF